MNLRTNNRAALSLLGALVSLILSVMEWIAKAGRKVSYSDHKMGRYISGIRRNELEKRLEHLTDECQTDTSENPPSNQSE